MTVQLKAWNDAFAYRMRIALQLQPYKLRHQASPDDVFLIVVDNVGSHKTEEVLAQFEVVFYFCFIHNICNDHNISFRLQDGRC